MSYEVNDEIDETAIQHGMNPTAEECFRHCPYLMFATILTSIGGVLVGFDIAILNGILVMPSFIDAMGAANLSPTEWAGQTSWLTSSLLLGAALSSPFAAPLADTIGRKRSINVSLVIIFSGGCIQAGSITQSMMVTGRMVVGIAIGLLSSVVPLYLAEISPKSIRGSIITLFQVMMAIGILLAFLITLAFNNLSQSPDDWRYLLGLQAAMPIGLFLLVLIIPESPRWLISKGLKNKAKEILTSIRWCLPVGRKINNVGMYEELTNIDVEHHIMCVDQDNNTKLNDTKWYNFTPLLEPTVLLTTSIGVMINILGQLTGFNSIIYYSSLIFQDIGISADKTTAIIGVLNVGATFMSVFLMDRLGRRVLLVSGSICMCISLVIVGGTVISTDPTSNPMAARTIAIFIGVFIVSFAYSFGPIAWLYPAEIFPNQVRTKGVSLSTCVGWLTGFAVNQYVPYMILPGSAVGGLGGTFFFFAGWTFFMIPWSLTHIYETKNMTLEAMNEVFKVKTFSEYKHYISNNISFIIKKKDEKVEKGEKKEEDKEEKGEKEEEEEENVRNIDNVEHVEHQA